MFFAAFAIWTLSRPSRATSEEDPQMPSLKLELTAKPTATTAKSAAATMNNRTTSELERDKIIRLYRNVVGKDSAKARSIIKKLDYKSDPYLLQCISQTYLDESRFDEDGEMRERVDWRKWRLAEGYIIRAFLLDNNDADVLWVMGAVRKQNMQIDIAIYCFRKIIRLGVKRIANGKRKGGLEYAKEMVNDSKFQLYRIFYDQNPSLAKRYLSAYKKGLSAGAPTIFEPLNRFLLG